ncbi:MAG: MATE family efflux transporter [Thermoplasmatota archaeon]
MPDGELTEGVATLLGEPKRAILKLSTPMVIAMTAQTTYNLADGIWVAGLGSDALAAVGLFFPFIMFLIALSNGLGVGGSAAISRRIGRKDKAGADNTAVHTLILGLSIGLACSLPFIPFLDGIFASMGATGDAATMATQYSRILFSGAIFIFFASIGNNILRGEGDAKRAMYALVLSSVLNIVLDPIFIYVLDLGVAGAAWATLLSMATAALLIYYWIFVNRDTYVDITWRDFHPSRSLTKEILNVGIPSSVAMLSMSFSIFLLNVIIIRAGGTDGVAVFTTGWRVVSLGTMPLLGIATGVTAVTAAAYGARDADKLDTAYMYAVKIGIVVEGAVAVAVFAFAPQITSLFTYAGDTHLLAGDITRFLRYTVLFYPTVPLGMLTSAMFRGINRGVNALVATLIRTVVLQISMAYLLGLVMDLGLEGVWIGIVAGNIIAAVAVTFPWGRLTVRHLQRCFPPCPAGGDTPH